MERPDAYLPGDRRRALAAGALLPERARGAALFADISGFTPLTDALALALGRRRGAEELTRLLNHVYDALVGAVERYGGSVIGFSGDAITCWFDAAQAGRAQAARRALATAAEMHAAMHSFAGLEPAPGVTAALAVKTTTASGPVRRFAVGDPAVQRIDVLAGATVDRMAAGEQAADKGESLADEATVELLGLAAAAGAELEWRTTGQGRFAVIRSAPADTPPAPAPQVELDDELARPWILPAVFERLHTEAGRFLAELRPATALFLRFGGLDYDGDEQAGRRLDAFVRWVQGVLVRREGTLIQLTTGDKGSYLYAAFGAPLAHDDDPARALAAALELRTPPPELAFVAPIQIGVSQGMMRVGAYGSPQRRTYGVLGDETNMAARLMGRAGPGEILVSGAVAAAVGDAYTLVPLGTVQLKGRVAPQPIFRALERSPGGAGALRRLHATPLTGRAQEIEQLQALLRDVAQAGEGRIVRLEGAAGVGKSHLVAALAAQAEAGGWTVAVSACQSTAQDAAYFAARQTARSLLRLDGEGDVAAQVAQAAAAVERLDPAWGVRLPLLGDLLGLPIADNATTAAFDPRFRQQALSALVVAMVQEGARRRPLLLLVEDAHWMDEASQVLALALARTIAAAPLVLLLVQRPVSEESPYQAAVAALPDVTLLALEDLPPDGVAALVERRLGAPLDHLALGLVYAQAHGNPFFVEEFVDSLREAGRLVQRTGRWELEAETVNALHAARCLRRAGGGWALVPNAPLASVDLGVPGSIHGIVLARLDRLPERAKLTLKVASVVGRVFELALLEQVSTLQPLAAELPAHLDRALEREFVRLEQPGPGPVYHFKHNITQEVAYATLLGEQQRALHLAVGEALERVQPQEVEALALHFEHADTGAPAVRERAVVYLEAAGRRAQRDYANETALSYFGRALALERRAPALMAQVQVLHLLGRRDEEHAALEQLAALAGAPAYDAALLWGEYYDSVSEFDAAAAALARGVALAEDADERARCLTRLGRVAWRRGDYAAAEAHFGAALAALGDLPEHEKTRGEIYYGLGQVHRQQAHFAQARAEFERALEIARAGADKHGEAQSVGALGHVISLQRDSRTALEHYRTALRIRTEIGDRAGMGMSLLSMAQALEVLGDYSPAEPLLRQALRILEDVGNRWEQVLVLNELGILHWVTGNIAAALAALKTGLALSRAIGSDVGEAYVLCNLGQVQRDGGDWAQAAETLHAALALAREQGDASLEATCLSDLALTSLLRADATAARSQAEDALAAMRALEDESSVPFVLAVLGAARLRLGEPARARAAVEEALGLLAGYESEGPDFSHRDYLLCAGVLRELGDEAQAEQALRCAWEILRTRAAQISDPAMRRILLDGMEFNREIGAAGRRAGWGEIE